LLTNLEVYSSLSSAPDLPLQLGGREDMDPIHIRDIKGLGPVKADINTTPFGSGDGGFYTGGSVNVRNIVLTLGFNPDWIVHTVSSLRQIVYGYFMSKQPVTLRFFRDDGPAVEIQGYTETNEPDIFSKDPEMEISVICPLPDFIAVSQSVVTGTAKETPDPPEYSEFTLVGNVDTSGRVVLTTIEDDPSPTYDGFVTLEHETLAPGTNTFEVTGSVAEGMDLIIDSARGAKVAENIIGAEHINLLNSMTSDSKWLSLRPGTNKFRIRLAPGAPDKAWTLTYYERFGGL
jgi:tail protein